MCAINFNEAAKTWDTEPRIARAKIVAEAMKARIHFSLSDRVLEFGCGTGLVSSFIIEGVGQVTLVDSSEGMLAVAREKFSVWPEKRVEAYSSIFTPALKEGSFDCAYASMSLHHVEDGWGCLRRLCSLLKPGGRLCAIDLMPDGGAFHREEPGFRGHNGFDPNELAGFLSSVGCDEESRSIPFTAKKCVEEKNVEFPFFMLIARKNLYAI
jgi:ubiquinone/menaquinone biosynthesis C-methylase UbiE